MLHRVTHYRKHATWLLQELYCKGLHIAWGRSPLKPDNVKASEPQLKAQIPETLFPKPGLLQPENQTLSLKSHAIPTIQNDPTT